jgi:hypothetical protein
MDELVVPHIDTHMAEGLTHGVEEHQVTGLQILLVDFFRDGGLFTGATRQDLTHGLLKHGAHKPTAIKTCAGVGSPTAIGHAQKSHGIDHQV